MSFGVRIFVAFREIDVVSSQIQHHQLSNKIQNRPHIGQNIYEVINLFVSHSKIIKIFWWLGWGKLFYAWKLYNWLLIVYLPSCCISSKICKRILKPIVYFVQCQLFFVRLHNCLNQMNEKAWVSIVFKKTFKKVVL